MAAHLTAEADILTADVPRVLASVLAGGDPDAAAETLAPVERTTAELVAAATGPLATILEASAARELGEFEPVERRAVKRRKPDYRLPPDLRPAVNERLAALVDAPFWRDVSLTRRRMIASAIRQGLTKRETAAQIEARIKALFGPRTAPARAALIARTEANFGVNAGAQVARERLAAAGIVAGKVWHAVGDGNTRETHRRADGQVRKVTGKFRVGGYWCAHPGDLSLPPGERCGCRCMVLSVPAADE